MSVVRRKRAPRACKVHASLYVRPNLIAANSRLYRCAEYRSEAGLTDVQTSELALRSLKNSMKSLTDGTIQRLKAKLREHNLLAPANGLPNELLVRIFALYPAVIHHNVPLGKLMLVCSDWKTLVRHTPSLWAQAHSDDPRRILLGLLARSGHFPLRVCSTDRDTGSWSRRQYLNSIVPEVYRWRYLAVWTASSNLLDLLETLAAPALETMRIYCHCNLRHKVSNLFSKGAAKLRHVFLLNTAIPRDSDLLRDLETLEISMEADEPSARQIVDFLRACTRLVRLLL